MDHAHGSSASDRPGPGRPREFDVDEAVRDAIEAFRTNGYHGTSVQDLMKGTGLAKGSLYKAFGDKRSLFLAALEQYATAALRRIGETLHQPGPVRAAIRDTLLAYARRVADSQYQSCLLAIAATELAPADPEVTAIVTRKYQRMQDLFAAAIIRGQLAGELAPDSDERAIARLLLCTMQGLRILGKTHPSESEVASMIDLALRALD